MRWNCVRRWSVSMHVLSMVSSFSCNFANMLLCFSTFGWTTKKATGLYTPIPFISKGYQSRITLVASSCAQCFCSVALLCCLQSVSNRVMCLVLSLVTVTSILTSLLRLHCFAAVRMVLNKCAFCYSLLCLHLKVL